MKTRTGKYRKGDPCFAVCISIPCPVFYGAGHLCMLKCGHKGKHKCTGCGQEWEDSKRHLDELEKINKVG